MEYYFEEYFKTKCMESAITYWENDDEENMWLMLIKWIQHKQKATEIFKNEDNIFNMILVANGLHKTGKL
jgi:hypothetical protein